MVHGGASLVLEGNLHPETPMPFKSALFLGLVGAVVGAAVDLDGALAGFAIGAGWVLFRAQTSRIDELEGRLDELAAQSWVKATPAEPAARPEPASVTPLPSAPVRPAPVPVQHAPVPPPPLPRPVPMASQAPSPVFVPDAVPADRGPGVPDFFATIVEFFTTGNLVAKVGVVILFFGVAFLLRFAAERGLLPIEFRLMGTAAGAMAMLGAGWWLRQSHADYAKAVQGGAVGILYLTIFAAYRLYALIDALPALALMLAVVVLSGALAVLQSSPALAALGTTGGFLAPILASSGSGSHVSLFSYYLILNAGVVGLAWFRAWRVLNWLGFVFTFGVGLFWGSQYYVPALFSTTEPFLIAFFLLYLAVVVLFALRQPPDLRGYIDGSLTFGMPAVAFAMQSRLVEDIPLGRAYSAVAVSAVYLLLARVLWKRTPELRALAEAFLALSVVFLTLAIPLAFDGYVAAAGWALEGAALVWVGFRQQRLLARTVGAMLLFGAGIAFGYLAAPPAGGLPVLNSRFLGSAAIAIASVVAGYQYFRFADRRRREEAPLEWITVGWGLLWWAAAVLTEVDAVTTGARMVPVLTVAFATTGVALAAFARWRRWPALACFCLPLLPILAVLALGSYLFDGQPGPWSNGGAAAWPVAMAGSFLLLWLLDPILWPRVARAWHAGTTWLLVFLLSWTAASSAALAVPESPTWSLVTWALVPAIIGLALALFAPRLPWPMRAHPEFYAEVVPAAPLGGALVWTVWAMTQDGDPSPLAYLPLLNPLEIAQVTSLVAAYLWAGRAAKSDAGLAAMHDSWRLGLLLAGFAAANAVVGRIVHFYAGVPFDFDSLTDSAAFQSGISMLWGVTALSVMTLATSRAHRQSWLAGAVLLGLLVGKLFLVDLSDVDGLYRIVSFMVTGLLILAIGYFSPVPPKEPAA
jgi:uncharacterized membrane protein